MQCGSVKILVFKPIISFVTVGYNDILAAVYVKELCQELVTSQMFGISWRCIQIIGHHSICNFFKK